MQISFSRHFVVIAQAPYRGAQKSQRALRSKKFNPDRKFQSRLETFNPDRNFQSRSKISIPEFPITGPSQCTEKGSIENFNPRSIARNFQSRRPRSNFFIPLSHRTKTSGYSQCCAVPKGSPGSALHSFDLTCCYHKQEKGGAEDRKFQSTIDRSKFSIPKAAIEFFQSPGPLGSRGFGNKSLQCHGKSLAIAISSRSQKGPTKPKNRTNSTKDFSSEQFDGLSGH